MSCKISPPAVQTERFVFPVALYYILPKKGSNSDRRALFELFIQQPPDLCCL